MLITLSAALVSVTALGCDTAEEDDQALLIDEEEALIADVSTDAILGNLTPELRTTSQRPEDIDAAIARSFDLNWRLMWEDLGRFFLTDRASRLTPKPMP